METKQCTTCLQYKPLYEFMSIKMERLNKTCNTCIDRARGFTATTKPDDVKMTNGGYYQIFYRIKK
jgi:hypothetical protein